MFCLYKYIYIFVGIFLGIGSIFLEFEGISYIRVPKNQMKPLTEKRSNQAFNQFTIIWGKVPPLLYQITSYFCTKECLSTYVFWAAFMVVLIEHWGKVALFLIVSVSFTSMGLWKLGDENQVLDQKVDFTSHFMIFLGKNTILDFDRNVGAFDRNRDFDRNVRRTLPNCLRLWPNNFRSRAICSRV